MSMVTSAVFSRTFTAGPHVVSGAPHVATATCGGGVATMRRHRRMGLCTPVLMRVRTYSVRV